MSIFATLTATSVVAFGSSVPSLASTATPTTIAVVPTQPVTETTRLELALPPLDTSTTLADPSREDIEAIRPAPSQDVPEPVAEESVPEVKEPQAEEVQAEEVPAEELAPVSMGLFWTDGPVVTLPPSQREDCIRIAKSAPLKVDGAWDQNLVAQMTHDVFSCLTMIAGLDSVAPTAIRRWNGASLWGFSSLSEQVAAEAVVVAYCEAMGFNSRALTGSNGYGYAGLFQMGRTEMARFGEPGSSRYDPVDNAIAAANYFIHQYRNRAGWGGWSPWAVVNTNFTDEVNSQVRVPVLPRFASTDPEYAGRRGPELPAWAVDPWSWEVPNWRGTGCSFTGRAWPAAVPIAHD